MRSQDGPFSCTLPLSVSPKRVMVGDFELGEIAVSQERRS